MFREDFVPSTCNKFYSIFCLCPTLDPSTFNRSLSLSLSFAPCLSVFLSPFPSPSRHSLLATIYSLMHVNEMPCFAGTR